MGRKCGILFFAGTLCAHRRPIPSGGRRTPDVVLASFPWRRTVEKKKTAVAANVESHTIPAPSGQKAGTWSETATRVLRERYLLRDATGAIVETPDEMCWRVASAVAAAETQWTKDRAAVAKTAQRFYDMMVEHRFLPNSPTLMNAGKGNNLQLSACYVVPVEDSLEGIFEAVKHAALIHQSGGGCISGDAHVFTTFCGVEAIETLYARVKETGRAEEATR